MGLPRRALFAYSARRYQEKLHSNLMQLAALADAQPLPAAAPVAPTPAPAPAPAPRPNPTVSPGWCMRLWHRRSTCSNGGSKPCGSHRTGPERLGSVRNCKAALRCCVLLYAWSQPLQLVQLQLLQQQAAAQQQQQPAPAAAPVAPGGAMPALTMQQLQQLQAAAGSGGLANLPPNVVQALLQQARQQQGHIAPQ